MRDLTISWWDLARIRAYKRRFRRNEAAIERMVRSIEAYGFSIPVLVTAEGEVVDGELRVKAARRMGWTQIPVIVCEGWTPEQVRGFRLMANQSTTWAKWDREEVALELEELHATGFELELTGFEGFELGELGEGLDVSPAEDERPVCGECGRKVRR